MTLGGSNSAGGNPCYNSSFDSDPMTAALEFAGKLYNWTLELSDPRTRGWFLIDSPIPVCIIAVMYLIVVTIGPDVMKYRKPFQLKWLLLVYNFVMALLNAYIVQQLLSAAIRLKYSYVCQPWKVHYHPDELQIVNGIWWFFFSKVLELMDTIFFILRKKNNQLSFLHVYHHSTMFIILWVITKWLPSGTSAIGSGLNAFVHIVMYTYYGLAALGPGVAKYLWWKKYLTILQLIQFVIGITLGTNLILNDCGFMPAWMRYFGLLYVSSILGLFINFYVKAYNDKQSGKKASYAINMCYLNQDQLTEKDPNDNIKKID